MGCIYLAKNKINGRGYIGKSYRNNYKHRKASHERTASLGEGHYFHKALRKYGFDSFEWFTLESNLPKEDIAKHEIDWIKNLETRKPNGYNLTDGGDGTIGISRKGQNIGRVVSPETTKLIIDRKRKSYLEEHGGKNPEQVLDQWVRNQQGKHFCKCGCGKPVEVRKWHRMAGISEYLPYHFRVPPPKPRENTEEDFWSKVKKTENREDCWLWVGNKCRSFSYGGKKRSIHQVSFFFHNKRWARGLVCHSCPNGFCVNPYHLFEGSHKEKMQGVTNSGKMGVKYTPNQILSFVQLVNEGMLKSEAAKKKHISTQMAQLIMKGKVWSHVTGIVRKGA